MKIGWNMKLISGYMKKSNMKLIHVNMQGIQVKFLCFFEAVHELFMNVQMLFKFHGNIQIFLIIFELVLEVFMNCSNFLNCS